MAQEPRSRRGALAWYPPEPPARPMIADSCIASAIVPVNTVIITRLALPAGTRYNTSGLEHPLRWPVLACPRMAGFEVSTEAEAYPRRALLPFANTSFIFSARDSSRSLREI